MPKQHHVENSIFNLRNEKRPWNKTHDHQYNPRHTPTTSHFHVLKNTTQIKYKFIKCGNCDVSGRRRASRSWL